MQEIIIPKTILLRQGDDIPNISNTNFRKQFAVNLDKPEMKCDCCGQVGIAGKGYFLGSKFIPTCKREYLICSRCTGLWRSFVYSIKYRHPYQHNPKLCPTCGNEFIPNIGQKYCKPECRPKPKPKAILPQPPHRQEYTRHPPNLPDPITGNDICDILSSHHNVLKEDPERLSTDFIKQLINKTEDPCPEISD